MAVALSASGIWASSKSANTVVSAKPMDSRPRRVQLKAFAPIHQPTPMKSDNLFVCPPIVGHGGANGDGSEPLRLDDIREALMRQEDFIIYELLKRAQWGFNGPIYDKSAFKINGFEGSLLEFMLKETEHHHAKVRRYNGPEEHAFFPEDLPEPILPSCPVSTVLHPAAQHININNSILSMYLEDLLPKLTVPEDDEHYGSASECDVNCLQALSRRIHYGKFVAEAKFLQNPAKFENYIRAQDGDAILSALTFKDQEENVKRRVASKASAYGQEVDERGIVVYAKYKISPDLVGALYEDWVMPLTKKVQVAYLLRRLD